MTMPIDIISRALKDIGALESGETPTPDAAQDAFDMFNDLIDQWSNENNMVFNVTEIIFPLIAGQVQYTIGPDPSTQNFVGASFTGSRVASGSTHSSMVEAAAVASGVGSASCAATGAAVARGSATRAANRVASVRGVSGRIVPPGGQGVVPPRAMLPRLVRTVR